MSKLAAAKEFVLRNKAVIAVSIAATAVTALVIADLVMDDDRQPLDVLIIETPEV